MPSSAVTLTVTVFAPASQVAAEPLSTFTVLSLVPFTVISIEALASAGIALMVLVAFVVDVV